MNTLKLLHGPMAALVLLACAPAPAESRPPDKPADIQISVAPSTVAPGEQAQVTLQIAPIAGVKINKYPKIKLEVPEQAGLVAGGRAEIGSAKPPPPDKMDTNYYKSVDPLELTLQLAPDARSGSHQVDGKLTYFYCVTASGFCAPARVPVKIPVDVR